MSESTFITAPYHPPFPYAMGVGATAEKVLWFEVDGKRVGEWDFRVEPPAFRGDVDASARAFCEAVLAMLQDQLDCNLATKAAGGMT